jgi:hypothetical protein
MYAFARLHYFVHEFRYKARLSGYSVGDGWVDDGEAAELRDSLLLAKEYLGEALGLDVVFSSVGGAPSAMYSHLRELMEVGQASATRALELLTNETYTFLEMCVSLGQVSHGVDMLSTAISSYDGYRTRYLLVEANVVWRAVAHRLGSSPGPPPFPTKGDRNEPTSD